MLSFNFQSLNQFNTKGEQLLPSLYPIHYIRRIMEDDNLIDTTFPPPSSRSGSRTPRKTKNKPPQDILTQFWDQFNTKCPGKVYTVLPDNPYARSKAARTPKGTIQGQNAAKSYDQAKRECVRSVNRIVQECERVNQKYTDPHFDIEVDLKSGRRDYLDGLEEINLEMRPKGVKRVTVRDVFNDLYEFVVSGANESSSRCRKFSRNPNSTSTARLPQMYARAATAIAGSWQPCAPWETSKT